MNLAELKEAYKARKLALDSAKKEEEKYKALLKDAMLEAGESDYTDEAGYRFERIVQERKSMDEEKLLAELHERNLTSYSPYNQCGSRCDPYGGGWATYRN